MIWHELFMGTYWELNLIYLRVWCFNFTYGTKIWGSDLKTLGGRFLRRAWRCTWCLTSKCIMWHPTILCWSNLENIFMELYALKLTIGFQQHFAHLPSPLLVKQATLLFQHLAKQGFDTLHKLTTMWKASWGLSYWETHDNPSPSKTTFNDLKKASLA